MGGKGASSRISATDGKGCRSLPLKIVKLGKKQLVIGSPPRMPERPRPTSRARSRRGSIWMRQEGCPPSPWTLGHPSFLNRPVWKEVRAKRPGIPAQRRIRLRTDFWQTVYDRVPPAPCGPSTQNPANDPSPMKSKTRPPARPATSSRHRRGLDRLSLLFLVLGLRSIRSERQFQAESVVVPGIIVSKRVHEKNGIDPSTKRPTVSRNHYVTASFADDRGQAREVETYVSAERWESAREDDAVEVRYLPPTPHGAGSTATRRSSKRICSPGSEGLASLMGRGPRFGMEKPRRNSDRDRQGETVSGGRGRSRFSGGQPSA